MSSHEFSRLIWRIALSDRIAAYGGTIAVTLMVIAYLNHAR